MDARQTVIQTEKLTLMYSDFCALNSLELSVPSQGITTILGSNGAGKTSFIKCALGLIPYQAGLIHVMGKSAGDRSLLSNMGVMMQEADLPDLLTPREHLTLICSYFDNTMSVEDLIRECDLKAFADKRYRLLSGGQKKRVQFAASIAGKPKLVFLDEPTTGLDTKARKVLWNKIRELSDTGTSVVLTTHYLEEADALADYTIVMHAGRTIAHGPALQIRNSLSGSRVRCVSNVRLDIIEKSTNTIKAQYSGKRLEVICKDGTTAARELFELDPNLSDLTVESTDLEDAFEHLIAQQEPISIASESNSSDISTELKQ